MNLKNKPQLEMLKKTKLSYGGELMRTRKGRSGPRPLTTRDSMHLVLRSSKAKGRWSFRYGGNEDHIIEIVERFSTKYGIKVLSLANVGNHLHFHIKLTNRHTYRAFIRAITSAIAMAVTGVSRWSQVGERNDDSVVRAQETNHRISKTTPQKSNGEGDQSTPTSKLKFWDYRPFTRIVQSFRAFLNLRDYIKINQYEGYGFKRSQARIIIDRGKLSSRFS